MTRWQGDRQLPELRAFLGTVIDFVIVSFAVFVIMRMLLKPEPAAPATKVCQFCQKTIPSAARKCRACASAV